jgi:hypothetical protein
MAIDVTTEKLLPLGEACRLLPSAPSPATLWRWRTIGVHGVKLECLRAGRTWVTSGAAVARFLAAQTAAAMDGSHRTRTADLSERDGVLERKLRDAKLID